MTAKGKSNITKKLFMGESHRGRKVNCASDFLFVRHTKKGNFFWREKFDYVKKKTKQARISNVEVNLIFFVKGIGLTVK